MKIAMVAMGAHGHINPLLPLTELMVAEGDEVVFFVQESMAAGPLAAGATVRPVPGAFVLEMNRMPAFAGAGISDEDRARWRAGFQERLGATIGEMPAFRDLIRAEAPDVVIYDPFSFWTPLLMDGLELPKVPFFPSYASPDGSSFFEMARRMGAMASIPRMMEMADALQALDWPFHAEAVNIVPLPRSFQPNADELDERYLFVGPTLRTREPAAAEFPFDRLEGRKIALVSLGTVVQDTSGFFQTVLEAFAGTDWLVVTALGRSEGVDPGALPDNVIARVSVPQIAVLQRASVFITHGGMNSTMEGLACGVPLIVAPQFADQFRNAERVAELGLGVSLHGQPLDGPAILALAESLSEDALVRRRLTAMQREIRESGGARRTLAAVRSMVERTATEPLLSSVS